MNITLLSTYPIEPARHGGQLRVMNMVAALTAAGHKVRSVGILGSDAYPPTSGFLPFPGHSRLSRYIDNPFLMEDWAIGRLAVEDASIYKALSALVDRNSDALFCEHPWLSAFAQKYRRDVNREKMMLVYESHNVESELKRQIIEAYYGGAYAEECRSLILATETEAIANADLISAVSQSDADWTREFSDAPIVVAPNGVGEARASIKDVAAANEFVGHHKFALYVASGHPPNVFGFYDLFGQGVGSLAPNQRMVVAGAAGKAIKDDSKFKNASGLSAKFIDAGIVSDSLLRGLLQAAHSIFLPMTSGGGTNLKTAEALWSGRSVVATSHAMRGFEAYRGAAGVHVGDDKESFLAALRDCMAAPRFGMTRDERDRRRALLWDETLRPMIDAIHERAS